MRVSYLSTQEKIDMANVITEAINLITKEGDWGTDTMVFKQPDGTTEYCLTGALATASGWPPIVNALEEGLDLEPLARHCNHNQIEANLKFEQLLAMIARFVDPDKFIDPDYPDTFITEDTHYIVGEIIGFNDDPARTKEEVLNVLTGALSSLKVSIAIDIDKEITFIVKE